MADLLNKWKMRMALAAAVLACLNGLLSWCQCTGRVICCQLSSICYFVVNSLRIGRLHRLNDEFNENCHPDYMWAIKSNCLLLMLSWDYFGQIGF